MQIKPIETAIMATYYQIKKELPALNRLTFEIGENSRGAYLWGFMHIKDKVIYYRGVESLIAKIAYEIKHHEILYRKF